MVKRWMAKAFANSHGQFKAQAARAGMSTRAFAEKEKGAGGLIGKRANLALVGMNAHHGDAKPRHDKWYGAKDDGEE